jgi:hypothetical protein
MLNPVLLLVSTPVEILPSASTRRPKTAAPFRYRLMLPAITLMLVTLIGNYWAMKVSRFASEHAPRTLDWFQTLPEVRRTQLAAPRPYLLYIGNSQVTLIRDVQPGDRTSYEWLEQLVSERQEAGERFVVYPGSLGGMTVTEALFTLDAYFRSAGRPALVVMALSRDLFRMVGARPEVVRVVREVGSQQELIRAADDADLPQASAALRFCLAQATPEQAASRDKSSPGTAEQALQSFAESLPIFAARDGMQRSILATFTRWRNHAFSIRSSTPRVLPSEIYRANLEMLDLLLRYASAHNLRLLLYLSPLRPLQPGPYSQVELRQFREDIATMSRNYLGVLRLDYLNLLPEGYWGNYPHGTPEGLDGQPDFAHMTGRGHLLLAQQLVKEANRELAASEADALCP